MRSLHHRLSIGPPIVHGIYQCRYRFLRYLSLSLYSACHRTVRRFYNHIGNILLRLVYIQSHTIYFVLSLNWFNSNRMHCCRLKIEQISELHSAFFYYYRFGCYDFNESVIKTQNNWVGIFILLRVVTCYETYWFPSHSIDSKSRSHTIINLYLWCGHTEGVKVLELSHQHESMGQKTDESVWIALVPGVTRNRTYSCRLDFPIYGRWCKKTVETMETSHNELEEGESQVSLYLWQYWAPNGLTATPGTFKTKNSYQSAVIIAAIVRSMLLLQHNKDLTAMRSDLTATKKPILVQNNSNISLSTSVCEN